MIGKNKNRKNIHIQSFRDILRNTLIWYAMIPILLLTIVFTLLFLMFWKYSIQETNRRSNEYITTEINNSLALYKGMVEDITNRMDDKINNLTIEEKVDVYKQVYEIFRITGYKGNLFIYDSTMSPIIENNNYNGMGKENDWIQDEWGIIREIKKNPDKVTTKLLLNDSLELTMGKAVTSYDEIIGYVIITIREGEFSKLLTKVSSHTIMTDKNDWIFLSNNYLFQDEMGKVDITIQGKKGFFDYMDDWYVVDKSQVFDGQYILYSVIKSELNGRIITMLTFFITIIFMSISSVIYYVSSKVAFKSTSDIDKIMFALEELKEGKLDTNLYIHSSKEFGQISSTFNLMVTSLKENIQEREKLSNHLAFTQRKQLESQFNPHFLFNTLDNIRFMARIDVDLADEMIVDLSSLLRYSIRSDEHVKVKEDMEYTENYLRILKTRFNRRFMYHIHISEEVKELYIPKLTIQSFIENSIKYGFEGDREVLTVTIQVFLEENVIIFICMDDGDGIPKETLQFIKNNLNLPENITAHHGIYNIHRRIQLIYGIEYGIEIQSTIHVGTVVEVRIPKVNLPQRG